MRLCGADRQSYVLKDKQRRPLVEILSLREVFILEATVNSRVSRRSASLVPGPGSLLDQGRSRTGVVAGPGLFPDPGRSWTRVVGFSSGSVCPSCFLEGRWNTWREINDT